MTLKSDAKFKENPIFCFKSDKNLVDFDPSTQKSQKICTLVGTFRAKYITFELKKYRGRVYNLEFQGSAWNLKKKGTFCKVLPRIALK